MTRQAKVGGIFLVLFAVLVYFAPGRSQKVAILGNDYNLVVDQVNGLREGDPVKFCGVTAGRVASIDFTTRSQKEAFGQDGRVVVRVTVDYGVVLPEDSRVSVEATVGGQRWVEITPGNSEVALAPGSVSRPVRRPGRQNQVEGSLKALTELSDRTTTVRASIQDPEFRRSLKDMASNARFYSNEFRPIAKGAEKQLEALDRNLDSRQAAVLRQLARVNVQIDEARARTEKLVPRVNEEITAWDRRIRNSEGEIRGLVDTAVRETERFRDLAGDAEGKVVGGKLDEQVRQGLARLATRIEDVAALAEDLHGLASSPEAQAELRNLVVKYRRQSEELRENLNRWERAIP